MAKEKIIEIKTGPAIKSIQDLKDNITAYKEKLKDLEIGTDEYKRTLKGLQENQAALRNAMYATTASLGEVMDAATAANVAFDNQSKLVKADTLSYNELVRELAILKEQWRATTNAAERLDLGRRINSVNDKLKEMDKSVGVFGRNVGNYLGAVDHLTAGLSTMGKGAAGIINPLKGVTAGFKTLSTTPAIAILGLLANILSKVIDALHSSEENTEALTQAMAPLQAIGDAVTKVLQALGKAVVAVVGWFGKLTQAIVGNNEATEKRLELAKQEQALEESRRANLVENAKAERDISELRAKASEKDKYTAQERLAFLEEAGKKEAEIAERARKEAEDNYNALKLKTSLTKSSREEIEALAQAEAAMIKADTDYYNTLRSINSGIAAARKEEATNARNAAKAVKDAATAKIAAEKEYLQQLLEITREGSDKRLELQIQIAEKERDKAIAEARQKITDAEQLNRSLELIEKAHAIKVQRLREEHHNKVLAEEVLSIKNRAALAQKGSVEYATAMLEAAKVERDKMVRQMDETDAAFQERKIASERAVVEAQAALNDALMKETIDGLDAQMKALREGSVEQLEVSLAIAQERVKGLYQGVDETQEQYLARRLDAEREVRKAEDALAAGVLQRDKTIIEARMVAMKEGSIEYLTTAVEMKRLELTTLHKVEGESNEAFRIRELQAEKELRQAEEALLEGHIEQDRLIIQQRMATLEEGSLEYLSAAVELKKYELDTLHQMEGESNEAFRLRELQAEKAYSDAMKAQWKGRLSIIQQAAQGISGILGSIADMYEENTEAGKEEAEKAKKLRIATATIDMLQGAVTAYAGAQSLGVPMGPIIGAINAAAVVAAGVANIAKIKAQKVDDGSSQTPEVPAIVDAPTASPTITQVRTITGASEEARLDKMASDHRVYILSSDLEADREDTRVRTEETTF